MKRLLLAAAAALALSVGVASCGSVNPDAVVVNGDRTSVRDLEQTLKLLAKASSTVTTVAGDSSAASPLANTNGTLNADVVRQVVGNLVVLSVFHDEFTKRQLKLADGATTSAAALPAQIWSTNDATWATLPEATRTRWLTRAAEYLAVRDTLRGPTPGEADVKAFYDANPDKMGGASYDDMKAKIESYLQGQAFNAGLAKLVQAADVKIDRRYGEWDPANGVVPLGSSSSTTTPPAAGAAAGATTSAAP